MKITILSTIYPFRGGIAQFNAAMYRNLEQKNEVNAVTFKRQYPNLLFPGKTQYVTDKDNTADKITSKQWLDSINPINWFLTAKKIKKQKPELLIMKFWLPFFGPCLGFVAKMLSKKTKSIAILDNVIPHEKRFFDMPFLRYFLKRTDGYIVMSEQVKNDLLKVKPDAKYKYSPHPLYNHFGQKIEKKVAQQKLNLQENKKTILFFGFIRDYKGLDLLIQAFEKLNEDYQLVIAGESYGSFDTYAKQIEKNTNKDRIHMHVRYINDNEVATFFSASDVCVLPYKSATQSGITSIAYHFDLPMISTNVGGLKEMVKHNKTGKIINTPEANEIADGIKSFFNDKDIDFVKNIQLEKEKLSWSVLSDNIVKLYSEIK